MPRPSKQTVHLKQIRNIKKIKSDNELKKNLEYVSSGEDPDNEIDNDFIYETDNSGDEWFNETISEELDDAFTKLIDKSKDKDVWKTEGRPKIYTGSSTRTLRRNKSILKKAAEGNASIKSFFQVNN
jgi:hypothetical protein